ncbi:SpdD protein [Streptomyces sp. NPDC059080]|uniref:SpdD protein n=1 Tax=Streptomyces sp. NPDC059080 TaxID=3346718 RepID=UPI00367F1474
MTQAPAPHRPLAPLIATGAGAALAVVAVGVVLTALLTAVAVGAISVAICAVVLRSLLTNSHHRR